MENWSNGKARYSNTPVPHYPVSELVFWYILFGKSPKMTADNDSHADCRTNSCIGRKTGYNPKKKKVPSHIEWVTDL